MSTLSRSSCFRGHFSEFPSGHKLAGLRAKMGRPVVKDRLSSPISQMDYWPSPALLLGWDYFRVRLDARCVERFEKHLLPHFLKLLSSAKKVKTELCWKKKK